MSTTYHIRVKKDYAASLIENLQQLGAIDVIAKTGDRVAVDAKSEKAERQVSASLKKCIKLFVYYFFNNTLTHVINDSSILQDINYLGDEDILTADTMEMVFTIYLNNLRLDENENVINHAHAMKRTAQLIRQQCEEINIFEILPPLEDWETVL